jgi:hypothetical protein
MNAFPALTVRLAHLPAWADKAVATPWFTVTTTGPRRAASPVVPFGAMLT